MTAVIEIPRERVVLDDVEVTAPMPRPTRLPEMPLAPPERKIPARELLAREGVEMRRSYGQHRELRETWSPWLKLSVYAVLVPLLFAVLAVLTGCQDTPLPEPETRVSTDSPDAGVVPSSLLGVRHG